jgi:tetratricopeptide (TPR) repeat protein
MEGTSMADGATQLSRARDLHRQSRWAEACEEFEAADRLEPLAVDDLEAFAEAAQVLGRGEEAMQLLRRAYEARVEANDIESAVTSAFWLWQLLIINAEFARANGWVAQVRRLTQQDHDWFLITDAYSLIGIAEYEAQHSSWLAPPRTRRTVADRFDCIRYHHLGSSIDQGRTAQARPQPTR